MSSVNCGSSNSAATLTDLRIVPALALWIIGTLGVTFPILAYSSRVTHIPRDIFKYVFTARCHFISDKLAQDRQIFWLWCHTLHSVYPPPRSRHQQAHLIMSWSRMEELCAHSTHLSCLGTLIMICSPGIALPSGACPPGTLLHLHFWGPCLPHWQSQAHGAWYPLRYVNCDFGLFPLLPVLLIA
jgi:hypothetical protein